MIANITQRSFLLLHLLLTAPAALLAQSKLSGRILDDKQLPVRGASVYLDNTLDGGTTDSLGRFQFTTEEKGTQTLVASAIGYNTAGKPLEITGDLADILLVLKGAAKDLDEVVISAGAFEASNDKDKTVLKPLDIVTTAGAQADVVRAIETLPGTQKQGNQNGLFVRGGDASEAVFIVDGLTVQNAFLSGPPGVTTRSRFNAFQLKGVSFSSGGYSARYGQAMSSVMELSTIDLPEKSTINLGANMAGVYGSGSKLWKKSGGDVSLNYTNLQPFYGLVKANVDYYKVPIGGGGSARWAWQPSKDGLFKISFAGNRFEAGIGVPDSVNRQIRFGIQNELYNSTVSYRHNFRNKWNLYAAGGYSYNKDQIDYNGIPGKTTEQRAQGRLEAKYFITSRMNILVGGELQHLTIDNQFDIYHNKLEEQQLAAYTELKWTPVYWLSVQPGLRYEHSRILDDAALSPRLSMAFKTGRHSQVSIASGIFYQNPDLPYLYLSSPYPRSFRYQEAIHYIANYQYQRGDRTLRIEGYYKDYRSLIREHGYGYNPATNRSVAADLYGHRGAWVDNSGYGYAGGAELFWRDKKTVKNADYWISYSYIDTRRLYKIFLAKATPDFIATHNLNVVGKYWIEKWQTQINGTYSYASGRPFYDPRNPTFLGDKTPEYHNLSITVNHLRTIKKWFTVVYAGVDNITNAQNIFGYRFTQDGRRAPIRPALYRSLFVGINLSLSQFDKDEL